MIRVISQIRNRRTRCNVGSLSTLRVATSSSSTLVRRSNNRFPRCLAGPIERREWLSVSFSPNRDLRSLSSNTAAIASPTSFALDDDMTSRNNERLGDVEVNHGMPQATTMEPSDVSLISNDATDSATVASVRIQLPQHYYTPRKASFVEDRVAASQLQYMEQMLHHVLSQSSYQTLKVGKSELRSLYLYWLSKPVRDLCYLRKCPDKPLQSADRLLHWMIHQFDTAASDSEQYKRSAAATIEYVLSNTNYGESVNAGLCRLLSLFLQPLQGTKAALQDHGRRTEDTAVQHVASLLAATRIHHIMQRLHDDPIYFPNLRPDEQSYQSILNLIGKRCKLLVFLGPPPRHEGVHSPRIRRGVRWSADDTVAALGGYATAGDCVQAALRVIDQMQRTYDEHATTTATATATVATEDDENTLYGHHIEPYRHPKPRMIHYSMLLSMMSYAAGTDGHCHEESSLARDALSILQRLEADPTFDHAYMSLYNPVLLALVQEATYFHRRQRYDLSQRAVAQCESLWTHLKETFVDDDSMSADPITYSIMLKLYRDVDQAEKAQAILDIMEGAASSSTTVVYSSDHGSLNGSSNHHHQDDNSASVLEIPTPTLMHYNTVLNALAKSSRPDSAERAMMLLRRMEEQTTVTGVPMPHVVPRPDRIAYTSALDAVLRGPNVEDVIDRMAITLLQRFEANEESHRRPDAITYNVLFHTLFRRLRQQESADAKILIAEKMEDLLRRLKRESRHFRTVAGSRVFRYYNDCLRAWAYTNDARSGERALQLLREMQEDGASGKFPSARPNGTTYQSVLATICRSRTVAAVHAAVEILEKMDVVGVPLTVTALNIFLGLLLNTQFEGADSEADDDVFVDIIMKRFRASTGCREDGFTAGWVLEGIFTLLNKEIDPHKREVIARRFEKVFRALLKEPQYFRLNKGHGLLVYYNKCLKVWAFARTPESTANALRLLQEMQEQSALQSVDIDSIECCRPNAKTYEYILTSLSRAPDAMSVQAARTVFRTMDEEGFPISLAVLNRFIRILVKSKVAGSFAEAELILKGVEDNYFQGKDDLCPNESTYSILVNGYTSMRSSAGVRDATRILKHMQSLYEKTKKPALLPTVEMCRDLMQRWSQISSEDAMDRVDELFHQMTLLSPPTQADYSALQAAWSKSRRPEAPHRVESILVRMQQDYETGGNLAARPTADNFAHVIQSWATSNQPGAAERADAILQHLEDLCLANHEMYRDLKPTTQCFEAALTGWANSDSAEAGERAVAILERMKRVKVVSPPSLVSINQDCYHYTILALGKSNVTDKAEKAHAILKEMQSSFDGGQNRYARPTHDSFRSVLNACATCTTSMEEQEAAAHVTLSVMRDYVQFAGNTGSRKDVYLQFLYTAFRLFAPGPARDDAVQSVLLGNDSQLQCCCPATIIDTPTIRDALEKTLSPAALQEILEHCSRR